MKSLLTLIFTLLLTFSASAQTKTVTVISEKANLRGTPSASGAVVEQVARDEEFELITYKGAWYLVQTRRFVGWLNGNTIKLNFDSQASEPVILKEAEPGVITEQTKTVILPVLPPPTTTAAASENDSTATTTRTYITGEDGGCYYINSNGNKTYVDRSLCGESTATTTPAPATAAPSNSGGSVQVRGYYRKDGTYVRPHTRSAPRRRN